MKNYIEVETKCGYIETLPIANMIVSVKKGEESDRNGYKVFVQILHVYDRLL